MIKIEPFLFSPIPIWGGSYRACCGAGCAAQAVVQPATKAKRREGGRGKGEYEKKTKKREKKDILIIRKARGMHWKSQKVRFMYFLRISLAQLPYFLPSFSFFQSFFLPISSLFLVFSLPYLFLSSPFPH